MIELLYSCALRVSELVGINLEDIDMNEGFVKVMGKGGKARFSPMGQTTIDVLKRYIKQRPNCANRCSIHKSKKYKNFNKNSSKCR